MKYLLYSIAAVLWIGALTGCGKKDEAAAQPAPSASLPAGFVLAAAPDNPVSVLVAKTTATDGQRIVIEGRVGGAKRAINDSRAIFTIADNSLLACDTMGDGDHCPTPWDYCCEDSDKLKAGLATVKIVNADGKPLDANLSTAMGLKPLQTVVVSGIAEPRSGDGSLVIRADGIYIRDAGNASASKTPEPTGCCPH